MPQKIVNNVRFEVTPTSTDPTALAEALAKSGQLIQALGTDGVTVTNQDSRVVTIKAKKKTK